eukprot:m.306901 g.306901  ORF g.306901 m.306901 type:complete len:71 (+) comp15927_c0_seq1:1398-1610(+)
MIVNVEFVCQLELRVKGDLHVLFVARNEQAQQATLVDDQGPAMRKLKPKQSEEKHHTKPHGNTKITPPRS